MGTAVGGKTSTLNAAHRHMFGWLPGLPASVHTNAEYTETVTLALADANRLTLPSRAVWAAEVRDGSTSYYVSYRGCTGYDSPSENGWCGGVQVVKRTGTERTTMHVAFLKNSGNSATFGGGGLATATVLQSVPSSLNPNSGTVSVKLEVRRGGGNRAPAPAPAPSPSPSGGCKMKIRVMAPLGSSNKYVAVSLNGRSVGRCTGNSRCNGFETCLRNIRFSGRRVTLKADASSAVNARPGCPLRIKGIVRNAAGTVVARKKNGCARSGCALNIKFDDLPC
jgi:hypothetical protein